MRNHARYPARLATLVASMAAFGVAIVFPPQAAADPPPDGGGVVGLSLFFQNSSMAPLTLVGDAPRYPQEIDILVTVPSPGDCGIEPLVQNSEFSSLNWRGVAMVEEDWRPAGDGTFIRQRFYRGAAWMEGESVFAIVPTNEAGEAVGLPLFARAGRDDRFRPTDDGFVRRFVARQVAFGCRSRGDVTGATFIVQGLAQIRHALHADEDAREIPAAATRLRLVWSAQPQTPRIVTVHHASASAFLYGYGFQPSLETVNPPTNGRYYRPGETVRFQVAFRDGGGNRLHPVGSLPTYAQFLQGEVPSGLRYYNGFALFPTTYYALKHREGLMAVALLGPSDRLRTPRSIVGLEEFADPQADFARPSVDGFTSLFANIPANPIVFGGDPADDNTPVSDVVPITIPPDILPGTYIASLKARREWGGEALNRAATIDLQVGTDERTPFTAKTGSCTTCHTGPSALGRVVHGLGDRRACFSCHSSLAFEPDAAADIRAHMVHSRSDRFRSLGDVRNCALCHQTPPAGPFRDQGEQGFTVPLDP